MEEKPLAISNVVTKTFCTTEVFCPRVSRQQLLQESHRWWQIGLVCFWLMTGCQRAPQIAHDPAVFKELDALYTAITAHNPELLRASVSRLEELHQAGQLHQSGYSRLTTITRQAAQAEWDPAAQALFELMRTQRPHHKPAH